MESMLGGGLLRVDVEDPCFLDSLWLRWLDRERWQDYGQVTLESFISCWDKGID